MGRLGGLVIAAVIATALPGAALACSPQDAPPLPPAPQMAPGASTEDVASNERAWVEAHTMWEQTVDEGAEAERQARLLGRTDRLVLVRIDRVEENHLPQSNVRKVTLKPLRWLSGLGPFTEFQLVFTDATTCGPELNRDAWAGAPGDALLVYLSGDQLRQDKVLDAIAVKHVVEIRALDALTWSDAQQ